MGVTIHINGVSNSLVHKGSMGVAKSTLPDVCKTPSPGGPMPVPYPVVVSLSSDLVKGTKTVKVDGGNPAAIKGSELSRCTGDEPGSVGGIKSNTFMKEAKWLLYSFDVKIEGKGASRLADKLLMNHGNTACLGGFIQKPVDLSSADSALWDECVRQHDKYKATQGQSASLKDSQFDTLKDKIAKKRAAPHEKFTYLEILDRRLALTKQLYSEREKYINMDCDQFNWTNDPDSTAEDRLADHKGELANVDRQIKNLYKLKSEVLW